MSDEPTTVRVEITLTGQTREAVRSSYTAILSALGEQDDTHWRADLIEQHEGSEEEYDIEEAADYFLVDEEDSQDEIDFLEAHGLLG